MKTSYCSWCGEENPTQPCTGCGHTGTTDVPPSQEPCACCGARPTWAVVWDGGGGQEVTIYLCASCDQAESEQLTTDD